MQIQTSRTKTTPPPTGAAGAAHARLPRRLSTIVGRAAEGPEREAVRDAFQTLSGLLSELDALDVDVFDVDATWLFAAAFRALRLEALDLADRAEEASQQAPGLANEELAGALAGLGFAIRHEMRRAFDLDLCGLEEPQPPGVARGKVAHAHGVLRNCFQQCVVLMARVYQPRLNELTLFDEGRLRLEESVALRDALASLIKAVDGAGGKRYPASAAALARQVEKFRRESMRLLMRRDWETFEGFAGEIAGARDESAFDAAREKLAAYLETLLSHVEMRSVLRQAPKPRRKATAARTCAGSRRSRRAAAACA